MEINFWYDEEDLQCKLGDFKLARPIVWGYSADGESWNIWLKVEDGSGYRPGQYRLCTLTPGPGDDYETSCASMIEICKMKYGHMLGE